MKLCLLLSAMTVGYLHVQAAVGIKPTRIEETRTLIFVDDKVGRTPPSLKLTLSLSGPEAESSVRYGNLKLEQAVDDKGTSLIATNDTFHEATKFKDYSNAFFRKSNTRGNSDPQAELNLALPARAATKISRLRGSLDLAEQGTIQTIELADLKGAGKKAIFATSFIVRSNGFRRVRVFCTGPPLKAQLETPLETLPPESSSTSMDSRALSSLWTGKSPKSRLT